MDTQPQRQAIMREIISIQNIGGRMPQSLLLYKQVAQIKVVLKLISKHLLELQGLDKSFIQIIRCSKLDLYAEANTRIKNHIVRKALQVKQMVKDQELKPYALLTLKSFSSILGNMETIENSIINIKNTHQTQQEHELCRQFVCE